MMRAAYVFDVYGTLLDVHSALSRHADAVGPGWTRLSEVWRAKQLEYTWVHALAGRYRDFARLTEEALDYAAADCGLDLAPDLRGRVLSAYRALSAHPDAVPCLERLRAAGAVTAVLSNGSEGMLADALSAAGLSGLLDHVLSVDRVRTFKTAPAVYQLAVDTLGLPADRIGFVSANRWDAAGAACFGLRVFWINRAGRPDEYAHLGPVTALPGLDPLPA